MNYEVSLKVTEWYQNYIGPWEEDMKEDNFWW